MSACTFFGHRQCHGLDSAVVKGAIISLIEQGVDTFYVGNQGQFDAMVYKCLHQLKQKYPHIRFFVVLAYLPSEKEAAFGFGETIFPEVADNAPSVMIYTLRVMICSLRLMICNNGRAVVDDIPLLSQWIKNRRLASVFRGFLRK